MPRRAYKGLRVFGGRKRVKRVARACCVGDTRQPLGTALTAGTVVAYRIGHLDERAAPLNKQLSIFVRR